jgi:hypothetical protein
MFLRSRRIAARSRVQRVVAGFLLLLFVSDLGFHVAEVLWASPETALDAGWRSGHGIVPHPDCGIPGHSGTLFHHHHFPAVLSRSSFVPVLTALAWIAGGSAPEVIPLAVVTAHSRAPPLA